jgi:hypothetical protein
MNDSEEKAKFHQQENKMKQRFGVFVFLNVLVNIINAMTVRRHSWERIDIYLRLVF